MIGTTFKLGFDGASVGRGLGNLSKTLGSFGKQIGIGAAQRIGHGMTDLMGRILMLVPDMVNETADWAGTVNDMSNQTGVAIPKLIQMEEALRISGASAKDTSRMISTLADNLNSAATEGGPAIDAIHKLGMFATDFKDIGIDESFDKIMRKVSELPPGFKGLESIMSDLFGARMGYKLIRFAKDFDGNMSQAANNVSKLGAAMERDAPSIDQFFDGLGRIENFKRSISSIAISEVLRSFGGAGKADQMFNFLDPEKLRPKISEALNLIGRGLEVFLSQDLSTSFGDVFKNIGKSIGEGIKESIIPSIPVLPDWIIKLGGNGGAGGSSKDLSMLIEKSNNLLADIRQEVGVSKWA